MKQLIQRTKHLLLMMLITFATLVQAQVATNYNFASSAGTYVSITGGTVLGTPTNDDQSFGSGAAFPIGFTFSYSGGSYTNFALNTNGFIALGTSATTTISSSYNAISSGISNNIIAAYNGDIQGLATTGELSYLTTGTTPNRILVIQWKNYAHYPSGTAGNGNFNFQIRLAETSNVISTVYNSFAGTSLKTLQVGLRGASNTDYNNRSTSTDWSATVGGATNAATCTTSTTVFPADGQIFTWTPASCIGVAGLNATAVTTTTATLNWSTNASAVGGYNVQYRVVGAPTFTAFAGNPVTVGTSANVSGLNPSATYEFQVQSICAGVGNTSSFSASNNFTTACAPVNVFPYFEGFEGITADGDLPNCMARTSNTLCLTYTAAQTTDNRIPRTGAKFGSFLYNTVVGGNYFYSAPLALIAGKTYDFSTWYVTDGLAGWTTLDAYVGPNQNPTGLVAIAGATVSGPTNTTHQQLAGSFVPTTTGTYYVALRCVATFPPNYLSFDDLSVISPCVGATFTTLTLPAGSTTIAYNQTIAATGGVAPYTFSVTNGILPAGLVLNVNTGVISGTPTTVDINPPTFTVTVSDATSCTTNKTYSITVTGLPCTTITVTPMTVPTATLGVLYPATAVQFAASGVAGATYTYSIASGILPSGMSLTATGTNAGRLTGTPTSVPASPLITVKARITTGPSAGCFGTVDVILVVNCPPMILTPTTISDAVINVPYTQSLSATYAGATGGFTYTVTAGALPLGFTLSSAGVLAGTGLALSTPASITIKATRGNGCNVSQTYTFGVVPVIAAPIQLDPMQISSSSFRARWQPVARAVKYRLYVASSPNFDGGSFAIGYVGLAVLGDTSILVQNLKPDTKYYIQITAISSADEISPYSNLKDATTLSAITGIDNTLSNQVKVSPNPSKDKFLVDFGTLNLGKTTARVYDAQGKQVFSSETSANASGNANQTTIPLGNMANGIYLLEITSNKGRILKRLVKE